MADMGYTKIFSEMLDSTVWSLSKEARLLFITFLLKKNREQIVVASVPGLARAANLTLAETESALKELLAPDKYSQSKEEGGRRILQVERGWFVVNGAKYRDMMSSDQRRAYKAAWQKEYRKRRKQVEHDGACNGAAQAINEGLNEANGTEG